MTLEDYVLNTLLVIYKIADYSIYLSLVPTDDKKRDVKNAM